MRKLWIAAAVALTLTGCSAAYQAWCTIVSGACPRACPGDCNSDGVITTDELTKAVDIKLGKAPLSDCASLDTNVDGKVDDSEIATAQALAQSGCPK